MTTKFNMTADMKKKRVRILLVLTLPLIVLCSLMLRPAYHYFSDFLSRSEPVNANVLIVEGWLPDFGLKMAYEEFQKNGYKYVITTGLKSISEYFVLSENGYLIFYPGDIFKDSTSPGRHIIEVEAYSELGGANSAHFNIFINDSLIIDYSAIHEKMKFPVSWYGALKDLDSIAVQFTNDQVGDYGDRNLYVKEVIIDKQIILSYQYNSQFDLEDWDGRNRIFNNSGSLAESAMERLYSLGIDSASIIAIPGKKVSINRTFTSALAFRNWLNTADINVEGINIISLGTHAKRTWLTYYKILDEKYNVGIISIPDTKENLPGKRKALTVLRETLGIIWYRIILLPY